MVAFILFYLNTKEKKKASNYYYATDYTHHQHNPTSTLQHHTPPPCQDSLDTSLRNYTQSLMLESQEAVASNEVSWGCQAESMTTSSWALNFLWTLHDL